MRSEPAVALMIGLAIAGMLAMVLIFAPDWLRWQASLIERIREIF